MAVTIESAILRVVSPAAGSARFGRARRAAGRAERAGGAGRITCSRGAAWDIVRVALADKVYTLLPLPQAFDAVSEAAWEN